MKKLIYLSTIALGLVNSLFAQDMPFVFDKNKIDVGTMYFYEYSRNTEVFEPVSKIYLYVKTLDEIEVVTVSLKTMKPSLLQKYKLNWNYMMLERMEFLSLKDKDKLVVNETFKSVMEVDYSKKIIKLNGTNKQEDGFKEFNTVRVLI